MRRVIKCFGPAMEGIKFLFHSERNAMVHVCILLLVIAAGTYFQLSSVEWMFIAVAAGFVLCAETINTAIEHLMNFIHPEYDAKVGVIKDIAADEVLLCAVAPVNVGAIIFAPKLMVLFE
jgi:diacylglycerol kinase (ATP)